MTIATRPLGYSIACQHSGKLHYMQWSNFSEWINTSRQTTLKAFAIIHIMFSFICLFFITLPCSLSNLLPVSDSSIDSFLPLVQDAGGNTSALNVPIHESSDLRNINVDLKVNPREARLLYSAQLYYSIFQRLVQFWILPVIEPITSGRRLPRVGFPVPDTYIVPSARSRLLTTTVATAVLEKMLETIDYRPQFIPLLLQATLSTKDTKHL